MVSPPATWVTRDWLRGIGTSIGSILALLLAVAVAAGGVAALGGMRAQVQHTDTLAPHLSAGDLVFVKSQPATAVVSGDMVGLHDAYGVMSFELVTAARPTPDGVVLQTAPRDGAPAARWLFASNDSVTQVRGRVPHLGEAAGRLAVPAGGVLLLLLGTGLAVSLLSSGARRN